MFQSNLFAGESIMPQVGRITASKLGLGTLTNSDVSSARKIFWIGTQKDMKAGSTGTNAYWTIGEASTKMTSVDIVLISVDVDTAADLASAKFDWTATGGTVVISLADSTLVSDGVDVHALIIGEPRPSLIV